MDSSMLYGYMFGGGVLMAAVAAVAVNFLSVGRIDKYVILGAFFVFAWIIHFGFLTWLQAEACSGVKSFPSIGIGSILGSIFATGCVAIPLHADWGRLAFSDMIMTHYAKVTPEVTAFASKFVTVMRQQGGADEDRDVAGGPSTAQQVSMLQTAPPGLQQPLQQGLQQGLQQPLQQGLQQPLQQQSQNILALQNLLNESEYYKQTLSETTIAAPMWAFLAGACGIGFGNLVSGSQCS